MTIEVQNETPLTTSLGPKRVMLYDPAASDKFSVAEVDAILQPIRDLIAQQNVVIAQLAAQVGGGSPTGVNIPPVMPDTMASFAVPANAPDGAIIGYVAPTSVGSPAPEFSIGSIPGVSVRSDTGDLILSDGAAFRTAVASAPLTGTVTAANTAGSDSTPFTLTSGVDYPSIDAQTSNMYYYWDALDNRQLVVNDTSLVTLFKDKSPFARHASNDPREKAAYVGNSLLGSGKGAVRSVDTAGAQSGLFFADKTVTLGVRFACFRSPTQFEVMFDQDYYSSAGTTWNAAESSPRNLLNFTGSIVGRTVLVSLVWTTTQITMYIDGVQAVTQPLGTPVLYPGMWFWYGQIVSSSGANTIISNQAILQNRTWKDSPMRGDLGALVQFLNVVEDASVIEIDTNPNAFSFANVTGAAPSSTQTSAPITVAGINAPSPLVVQNGLVSINGGAFFATQPETTVVSGDIVQLRATAPADASTSLNVICRIGTVQATWSVSTAASNPAGTVAVFSDNFNRAADETLETSTDWTRIDGTAGSGLCTVGVLCNAVSTLVTTAASYHSPDLASTNNYVQARFRSSNAASLLCTHLTNRSNYLGVRFNNNTIEVIKRVAGTSTTIATYTQSWANTVLVRLDTNGSTFTVKANGVTLTPLTGSETITSGPPSSTLQGVALYGAAVRSFIDDYQAGVN